MKGGTTWRALFVVLLCHAATAATETKLLMVGNSYTRGNSMDSQIESMLNEHDEYRPVAASSYTPSGASLKDHLDDVLGVSGESNQLQQWLASSDVQNWTWVVLQDQSVVGARYGIRSNWNESRDAAVELNKFIEATGAETVFFMTWGRRNGHDDLLPDFLTMTEQLRIGYEKYAEATSTLQRPTQVAPVGLAFKYIYDQVLEEGGDPLSPDSHFFNLYTEDGSHPSRQGSYLAACVIYATLTGKDPRQLRYGPNALDVGTRIRLRNAAHAVFAAFTALEPSASPSLLPTAIPTFVVSNEPTQPPALSKSFSRTNDGTQNYSFWCVLSACTVLQILIHVL